MDKDSMIGQSRDDIEQLCKKLKTYREMAETGSKEEDLSWIKDLLSHLGESLTQCFFYFIQ